MTYLFYMRVCDCLQKETIKIWQGQNCSLTYDTNPKEGSSQCLCLFQKTMTFYARYSEIQFPCPAQK